MQSPHFLRYGVIAVTNTSWYGLTNICYAVDYTFNPRYRFRQAKISCRRGIASPLGT